MFDDDNTPQSGHVPNNLPIGDPEDMFTPADNPVSDMSQSSVPTDAPVSSSLPSALDAGILRPKTDEPVVATPAQDMFAGVDSTPIVEPMSPPSLQDLPQNIPPLSQTPLASTATMTVPPAQVNPANAYNNQISEPIGSKKTLVWIIVLAVVLVLGVGGAWIYFSIIKPQQSDIFPSTDVNNFVDTNSVDTSAVIPDVVKDNNIEVENNTISAQDTILLGEPLDTDGDGLDDVREKGLGTSPTNWDTDGDSLDDGTEVTIWKTDPLNSDTDGDGFSDGTEIKNGYNPIGPGKLFQPPTSTEKTK